MNSMQLGNFTAGIPSRQVPGVRSLSDYDNGNYRWRSSAPNLKFANAVSRFAGYVGSGNTSTYPVRTLTSSGTLATATVDSTAMLATGQRVRMGGATEAAFNIDADITVLNGTQFTYAFAGNGNAPATGSPTVNAADGSPQLERPISSISRVGALATVNMTTNAGMFVGEQILITGCNEVEYNGLKTIVSLTGGVGVDFNVSGTPVTPATGSPKMYHAKRTAFAVEIPFILGSTSWESLKVIITNWAIGETIAGISGIQASCTPWDILECSVRFGTTAYVPIRFGGAVGVTVPVGGAPVLSDAFTTTQAIDNGGSPVAITFAQGTIGSIKLKVSAATAGLATQLPMKGFFNPNLSTALGAACYYQCHNYSLAATAVFDVTTVNRVGPMTLILGAGQVDGTTQVSRYENNGGLIHADLVGVPINAAAKVFLNVGDSISFGVGDTAGTSIGNRGWFVRALFDGAFTPGTCYAGVMTGVSSQNGLMYRTAYQGANVSWFTDMFSYISTLVDSIGTNGAQLASSQALWAAARAIGCKVVRTNLPDPNTGSTDNWATTINQTPTTTGYGGNTWGVAGNVKTLEDTYVALTGTATGPTHYLPLTANRSGGATDRTTAAYWLWLVNGVANYATPDGVHSSSVAYGLIAAQGKTFFDAM